MAFVDAASGFPCDVRVRRADGDEVVDGKSIMQMLLLAATQGTELEITCEGEGAAGALAALVQLVERRFDEE
jgi:phosphocarrier protein